MLGKQNKYQLAFKAQYLPILAVATAERAWFGDFFAGDAPGFALLHF